MENTGLLFDKKLCSRGKMKIRKGCLYINCHEDRISGSSIKKIIAVINGIKKSYSYIKIPLCFVFQTVRFEDKLTYIVLECIFYHLMKCENRDIRVLIDPIQAIDVEGVMSSPLLLLSSPKKEKRAEFIEKFEFEIYMRHFRKIVRYGDIGILDELNYFLKVFEIDEENREDVCEVISELISNGTEHADGECLIDIDVTDIYGKERSDGDFYGINIVVLNLSNVLLGTQIKNKILSEHLDTDRYKNVQNAYNYHKKFFDESYMEEDFFNMAVFQHRISVMC